MLRCRLFLIAIGAWIGCAPAPAAAPQAPIEIVTGPATTSPTTPVEPSCSESDLPVDPSRALREQGLDAFVDGRMEEAAEQFVQVARSDHAAAVLVVASARNATLARVPASGADALVRISLEPLPLAHTERRKIEGAPAAKVRLEKVNEARNKITDDKEWEQRNALTPVTRHGAVPTTSPAIGATFAGAPLRTTFVHGDHVIASYGNTLIVAGPGKEPLAFDVSAALSSGPQSLEVTFAQLVGSALVLELWYNGYSKDAKGKNAYVAAYDIANGALLWSSEPLVGNVHEGVVSGGSIIVGYGFTAEPDFLFVLDLATGRVDQKIPVKSGPELVRLKADRLFVRTYDTDYVFKSTTGFAPPPPARLAPQRTAASRPASPPPLSQETRCWVHRAGAAIAARDASEMHRAERQLETTNDSRLTPLVEILRAEVSSSR